MIEGSRTCHQDRGYQGPGANTQLTQQTRSYSHELSASHVVSENTSGSALHAVRGFRGKQGLTGTEGNRNGSRTITQDGGKLVGAVANRPIEIAWVLAFFYSCACNHFLPPYFLSGGSVYSWQAVSTRDFFLCCVYLCLVVQ